MDFINQILSRKLAGAVHKINGNNNNANILVKNIRVLTNLGVGICSACIFDIVNKRLVIISIKNEYLFHI